MYSSPAVKQIAMALFSQINYQWPGKYTFLGKKIEKVKCTLFKAFNNYLLFDTHT